MNQNVILNIGDKESCLQTLIQFKENKYVPFYVRINNSHIKLLNNIIGRTVFKKDAVYISSLTLWEIMQPRGRKGTHNYHGLMPEDVYNALSRIKYSKNVYSSFDDRYVVITDVFVTEEVRLIVIVSSDTTVAAQELNNVVSIITIYPSDKEK